MPIWLTLRRNLADITERSRLISETALRTYLFKNGRRAKKMAQTYRQLMTDISLSAGIDPRNERLEQDDIFHCRSHFEPFIDVNADTFQMIEHAQAVHIIGTDISAQQERGLAMISLQKSPVKLSLFIFSFLASHVKQQ